MNHPPFENLVERQVEMDLPFDGPVCYIDMQMRNGTTKTEGPYSRWVADMLIGCGMVGPDVAQLTIRPVTDFDRFVGDA